MKRLASEVLRDLEVRMARLEARNRFMDGLSRYASSRKELSDMFRFLKRKESIDFELENIKLSNRGRRFFLLT